MSDELLQQGIAALKAGQKAEARRLLKQVVRLNPGSERGWIWLSGAVDTDEQRRFCLLQVLTIDPRSATASRGLEKLGDGDAHSPLGNELLSITQAQLQSTEANTDKTCSNCSAINPYENHFCNQCGSSLDQPSTLEPEPAGIKASQRAVGMVAKQKPSPPLPPSVPQHTSEQRNPERTPAQKPPLNERSKGWLVWLVLLLIVVTVVISVIAWQSQGFSRGIVGRWSYETYSEMSGRTYTLEIEFFGDGTVVYDAVMLGTIMERTGRYEIIDNNHLRIDTPGLLGGSNVLEYHLHGNTMELNGQQLNRR